MATSGKHRGFLFDAQNGRLAVVYNGTEVWDFDGNDMDINQNLVASGTVTVDGATTLTGVVTMSAEARIANGFNLRIGTISAFGTTEPTNWTVWRAGTQPAGAITTAGGIGANTTTVQKIIAAGTINNVET